MPRDIPVGNGRMLVMFDEDYQIRDIYYPHVGKENQAGHKPCRMGVWVDGQFSWMGPDWTKTLDYRDSTLVTDVVARNEHLGIELHFADCVDYEEPVFVREIRVKNLHDSPRDVRLFFHYKLNLYHHEINDTACYDPTMHGVLQYKGRRYCIVNVSTPTRFGVDQFTVGEAGVAGKEGTWRDAEDGDLSGNAVANGSVDSTIALNLNLQPHEEQTCYAWLAFGRTYDEINSINTLVWEKTPAELIRRTHNYWLTWATKEQMNLGALPPHVAREFTRSLLILATQTDIDGAIISGSDSDWTRFGGGGYTYMSPREATVAAVAFDLAGYSDLARRHFIFCAAAQTDRGYLMPRYEADADVGPIFHPLIRNGTAVPPAAEDDTAIAIHALWKHFQRSRDVEFVEPLYRGFVTEAAEFLAYHVDDSTGLPLPSLDVWDQHWALHTHTAASVVAGLWAAAKLARAFGDNDLAHKYNTIADHMKSAMVKYLYHHDLRRFARMAHKRDGGYELDMSLDTSLMGLWSSGTFAPDDPRVVSTMEQLREHLFVPTEIGGVARFQNDPFHRVADNLPGNPWPATTAWLAQWYVACAHNVDDLNKAMPLIEWVCRHALPSGVLPEQVNPYSGEPLSASPSTLSHAKLVHVVMLYLHKLEALRPEMRCRRTYDAKWEVYEIPHMARPAARAAAPEQLEVEETV